MSNITRFIDQDLVAKMQNGWKPKDEVKAIKKLKPPRAASTYRGARRNAHFGRDK